MKPIDKIKKLLGYLSKEDLQLAHLFIERRDFEDLKDLVDSAIYRIDRKNLSEEELKTVHMEELLKLKSEVDWYVAKIDL